MSPCRHGGFTLIELLVVIAIIAILAAILFPIFGHAREKARQSACTNNQRQIALAAMLYAQDHEETLPPAETFWSCLAIDAGLRRCPTRPALPNGYVYHGDVADRTLGSRLLGDHTTTALLGDGVAPDQVARKPADYDKRHNGKALVTYLDQHTEMATAVAFAPMTRNPVDGAALVHIPAATFTVGDAGIAEPVHQVTLTRGYYLYRDEVTVAQYRAFCTATGRAMPPLPTDFVPAWTTWDGHDDHPIVMVTWDEAAAYAAWAGGSLPTDAQWEYAARGPDGRQWPWGNTWDGAKCVNSVPPGSRTHTEPVGSIRAGDAWCGARDMAGNAWEWCADWYGPYTAEAQTDPTGPASGPAHVMRGGSWGYNNEARFFRTAYRLCWTGSRSDDVGFRCVLSEP